MKKRKSLLRQIQERFAKKDVGMPSLKLRPRMRRRFSVRRA